MEVVVGMNFFHKCVALIYAEQEDNHENVS